MAKAEAELEAAFAKRHRMQGHKLVQLRLREPLWLLLKHFAYEEGLDVHAYLVSKGLMAGLARPRTLPYEVTLTLEGKVMSKEHKLVRAALRAAGPDSRRGARAKGLTADQMEDTTRSIDDIEATIKRLGEQEEKPQSQEAVTPHP